MHPIAVANPAYFLEQINELTKQCQIRFTNRYELATECDKIVFDLCLCLENIVYHGFNKYTNFFQRHKLPANLPPGPPKGSEVQFWNYISLYLTDYEVKRFQSLRHVRTDLGRSRSWLRNTLNEHSLIKYFAIIFEDRLNYRRHFYQPSSLMTRPEVGTALRHMVEGLNNILFALNIDNPDLDVELMLRSEMQNNIDSKLAPVVRRDSPSTSTAAIPIKAGNKKKSNVIHLKDREDDDSDDDRVSPGNDSLDFDQVAHSAPVSKLYTPTGANRARLSNELSLLAPAAARLDRGSQSSLHSLGSNTRAGSMVLVPVANDEATSAASEATTSKTTSNTEAAQPIVDTTKEKLIKENNLLRIQLKKYIAAIELMKYNHRTNEEKSEEANKTDDGANEQPQQQSEPSATTSSADLVPSLYSDLASYEKKLVQVSDMHGELVEFNEHLYRVIQQKDSVISRLRDELVELRGPLPDSDDILSICSESEAGQHSIVSLLPQPLIHIWIPTAFLSGGFKGKSHHIYQIYIRLRDEEWNVYRRYSQFYTLHRSLKERYAPIGELEFPPKKAIGNKDSKVVQERRKKLECYLRNVINHLQTVNAEVSNKDKLIAVLPFLSDKFFLQDRSHSEANLATAGGQANAAAAAAAASNHASPSVVAVPSTPNAYMGF